MQKNNRNKKKVFFAVYKKAINEKRRSINEGASPFFDFRKLNIP